MKDKSSSLINSFDKGIQVIKEAEHYEYKEKKNYAKIHYNMITIPWCNEISVV